MGGLVFYPCWDIISGIMNKLKTSVVLALLSLSLSLVSTSSASEILFEVTNPASQAEWSTFATDSLKIAQKYIPDSDQEVCTVSQMVYRSGGIFDQMFLTVYEGGSTPDEGTGLAFVYYGGVYFPSASGYYASFEPRNQYGCPDLLANHTYWFVWSRLNPLSYGTFITSYRNSDEHPNSSYWQFENSTHSWVEYPNREWSFILEGTRTRVPGKEPVLIIPGIAGTELYNGNDLIWADLDRMKFNNDQFLIDNLALDIGGIPLTNAYSGSVIKKIRDLLIFETNIFEDLEIVLTNNGYQLNQSLFYLPYDWRLDLETTKEALNQKIQDIKTQTGSDEVSIIAHSMGGLIAKEYIDTYGKNNIDKLIFVGTPHLGAPKVAKVLMAGDNFEIPWLEKDRIKELSLNMPSVYELLPNQTYNVLGGSYLSFGTNVFNSQESLQYVSNNFNQVLASKAQEFSNQGLDLMDFSGVDAYNIAGCKVGTQGSYRLSANGDIKKISDVSGDKTVPLVSASTINIPDSKKFYILNGTHAELPSNSNTRSLILDILSGDTPQISGDITQNYSDCQIKGKSVTFQSPVEVHVYDAQDNHTGPIENGGIEYGIPSVDYEIINHRKFIFLPTDEGQMYRIEARGTDAGSFDLFITENENGQEIQATVFNDVAILPDSQIEFMISDTTSDDQINFDYDNDGQFEVINSSSLLDSEELNDLSPPNTEISIFGVQGNNGWYRSDMSITLSATDDNSGILETRYSINGSPLVSYLGPVSIGAQGTTMLKYYSVDKAGNNEEMKAIEVKIDKTAPEFGISFNADQKGFIIVSNDSISCTPIYCAAEDEAGNESKLNFSRTKVGNLYVLSLKSIVYNGQINDLKDNIFAVKFAMKNGQISEFSQTLLIKSQEIAGIYYDKKTNKSTIVTYQDGQVTKEVVDGVRYLVVKVKDGTISVSY